MKPYNYIKQITIHILLGIVLFSFKPISTFFLLGIVAYFSYKIFTAKKNEQSLQILIACSYIVGAEVLIRMTGGSLLYEASKYLVIIFCLIGFFKTGLNLKSIPFILYFLLIIPGIFVAGFSVGENTELRKAIAFNLSGPVCLGIVAMFCYQLKIRYADIHKIFNAIALPLISTTTYLFLYAPSIKEIVTGTGSNFAASGGFGPNQVATVLGLGMFVLTVRFFMNSNSIFLKGVNLILLALLSYRGIVTFSRGGIVAAVIMIVAFLFYYFNKSTYKNKTRISQLLFVFISIGLFVWVFSSIQTSGFIDKRYANQDGKGREKKDITTGRKQLVSFEFNTFFENPILGVGVGKIKELRLEKEGVYAASHNELSRILAEHGLFGIFAFLILLITPLVYRIKNKKNIFFYSFYFFWFLTINHSSMRIAAPAFIYGLCLLNIKYEPKRIKHKN
ncbi:MAG: O-antigen ligase family protein [Algibacter sp.]